MFCWHNKRILLHKYQQNIFVHLTKTVFSLWCNPISIQNKIHTNGRLPLKLHTTVKEGATNLEKKLFTVSVYARGLR